MAINPNLSCLPSIPWEEYEKVLLPESCTALKALCEHYENAEALCVDIDAFYERYESAGDEDGWKNLHTNPFGIKNEQGGYSRTLINYFVEGGFVVKRFEQAKTKASQKVFLRELSGLLAVQKVESAVKLFGWMLEDEDDDDGEEIYDWLVFMEYVEHRHVGERLEWLSPSVGSLFMEELSSVLCLLHESGIAHRDLKPENVLMSGFEKTEAKRALVKLCDFGAARTLTDEEGGGYSSFPFPQKWKPAPEQIEGSSFYTGAYDKSVDVFGFGGLALKMLLGSGLHPLGEWHREQGYKTNQKYEEFMKTQLFKEDVSEYSELMRLLVRCCAHEPDARPTMREGWQ